jgi:DNA (cytosine-5)-methyltransferase 1
VKNQIISLFSGAGGMDLGFQKAGFSVIWANEYDKNIWETHKYNFPETDLCQLSIRDIDPINVPDCIGLIGGPPCQSFSEGGSKRGTQDPRGQLFWDYIRILKAKNPLFFVAENVSGLLSERHATELKAFLEEFDKAGYDVVAHLYKASHYGLAQDRERVIFVGYRKDLNKKFHIPIKHTVTKTLQDVIGDLWESQGIKNGQSNGILPIPNHEHMLGGFSSMYMSRNRVRNWQQPSFTILAMARQAPIHPNAPKMQLVQKDKFAFVEGHEYRRLSVRECARIQDFPDDFIFHYTKIENGYKMVGNAVPVGLAKIIGEQIKKDLNLDF